MIQTTFRIKLKISLIKEEVLLEGYGGDVPFIEVSAKNGYKHKRTFGFNTFGF